MSSRILAPYVERGSSCLIRETCSHFLIVFATLSLPIPILPFMTARMCCTTLFLQLRDCDSEGLPRYFRKLSFQADCWYSTLIGKATHINLDTAIPSLRI